MALMSPVDAGFLLIESREHPMHVGGLSLFTPPNGMDPSEFARSLHDAFRGVEDIRPIFRRKPGQLLSSFSPVSWAEDLDVDLEYHVRLLALPKPGRVRELLELASMLHGTLLDRHRPLWEAYVIEGLEDGRVAVFSKTHHALMDGVSAALAWYGSMSPDPAFRDCAPPWQRRARRRPAAPAESGGFNPLAGVGAVLRTARDVAGVGPALVGEGLLMLREDAAAQPFQAPPSIFNVPITGARRFAAQSWPKGRVLTVSKGAGVSFNDAVLGICSGALRRYLLELDALPEKPLIAMVPVSLRGIGPGGLARGQGESEPGGGNALGAVLCDLGTDLLDPASRLHRIHESMGQAKAGMDGRTTLQITALSGLNLIGMGLQFFPGASQLAGRPAFNIVISNVPGPAEVQYWNGGRLESSYPASIPMDDLAVNITVISYADTLQFGIVGCRRSVPKLQRLLVHLEDSLAELEDMIEHDAY
ncbi:WS/DGAT/MGAT family O-acyltransferase [Tomitella biformata]|uniref:WS/DGAT/MGAT family O-acyltransferase n=1 Tax=Tomitella biformata TaxID=630403 RepID=UPI0004631CD8|nr:wax ester/triacylglycerol synthase family O-acyltransferase [Tomitella biformata]